MKPIVTVSLDIALFYKRVTDIPFNERSTWVTDLASSLVERDHSHSFASDLLVEAQGFKDSAAHEKRMGRARKALKDAGCDPHFADSVDDPESVLKGLKDKTRGLSSPEGSCLSVCLTDCTNSPVLTPKVPKRNTVPARENGLQEIVDAIWSQAPAMSRQRSSKPNLLKAIQSANPKIDVAQLPAIIAGLGAWMASEKWTKDNGQFQEGIHRWVNGRQWETPPQRTETWQEKFERETRELEAMQEVRS